MPKIKNLTFNEKQYPEILVIANKLAKLEKRKPHDVIAKLILDAGTARINEMAGIQG